MLIKHRCYLDVGGVDGIVVVAVVVVEVEVVAVSMVVMGHHFDINNDGHAREILRPFPCVCGGGGVSRTNTTTTNR